VNPTLPISLFECIPSGHVLVLPEGGGEPRPVPAEEIDGRLHFAAAQVAGILRATSYWRPETRKLLLRTGGHRVRLGVDNPFVIVDDVPHRMPPPRFRDGRLWSPLEFFLLASRAGVLGDARWDPRNRVLALGTSAYSVGAFSLEEDGDVTRLSIQVREGLRPQVISASYELFVVRVRRGVAPPSILGIAHSLGRFARVEIVQGENGVDLYMKVTENARGYALRALTGPSRIEILVADHWGRHGDLVFQPFQFEVEEEETLPGEESEETAPTGVTGPRLVVIDPGHGGEDPGSESPGGLIEKHLTLEIAQRLKRHLESEGDIRVRLVRDRDERVDVPRRAEIANGLRADLFLSLHCDLNGPKARGGYTIMARGGSGGQLLYEDLSPFVPGAVTASDAEEVLSLVRWESVGAQHALASLHLGNSIAARLGERFPTSRGGVVTRPVWNLEGVRMPGVLIEVGALDTASAEETGGRRRGPDEAMNRASNLDAVAAAIAAGVRDALMPPTYGAAEAGDEGSF
jgi:N-acetylmuramoyl-L-alanine amidase